MQEPGAKRSQGATVFHAGCTCLGSALGLVAFLVQRGGDLGRRQVLAKVLDVLLGANIAVVGVVQDTFDPVQQHSVACPLDGFYVGAQVVQQGFDLTPVNVAAYRVLEDRVDQGYMFVAHALPRAAWLGCLMLENRGRTMISQFCQWYRNRWWRWATVGARDVLSTATHGVPPHS